MSPRGFPFRHARARPRSRLALKFIMSLPGRTIAQTGLSAGTSWRHIGDPARGAAYNAPRAAPREAIRGAGARCRAERMAPMGLQLYMVGLTVTDMDRAMDFYRRLGLDLPAAAAGASHV